MISSTKVAVLAIAATLASAYHGPPQVAYSESSSWKLVVPTSDNTTSSAPLELVKFDFGWYFNLGYGGRYESRPDWADQSVWHFSYDFHTKSDIKFTLDTTILHFY